MTHLFLIRHAEAHVNLKAIAAGPIGDTGLTDLGIIQAGKLRERLDHTGEIKPDVVISSDLPRARQTAEIVASLWSLPVILDEELREISPGEADGLTLDEIRLSYNLDGFWHDHFQALAPGGESHAQFSIRAAFALKRITGAYEGKTVVIFTHGSIIDSSFSFFFNISPLSPLPVGFSNKNTAITHWEWTDITEYGPARWKLNCHNDAAHLKSW